MWNFFLRIVVFLLIFWFNLFIFWYKDLINEGFVFLFSKKFWNCGVLKSGLIFMKENCLCRV